MLSPTGRPLQWQPSNHLWRRLALLVLALGVAERGVWVIGRWAMTRGTGESDNVAVSFARTGVIGDTFARGSGPTAHVNPLMPTLAGSVYRQFGVHSPTSEVLLCMFAVSVAMITGYIFFRAFLLIGMRQPTALVALALFCLAPLNLALETSEFRVWEGGIAVCLSAFFLLWVARLDPADELRPARFLLLSALAAAILFINPALGLACYVACALVVLRSGRQRRPALFGLIAMLSLGAVLTPWSVRNYQTFGRVIPLRSNAGLELAIANHKGLEHGGDDRAIFADRLREIHPEASVQAFVRMQAAGGEIAYANHMGHEAVQWIELHPLLFLKQCLKHLRQYYFPPSWLWEIYGASSHATTLKMVLSWIVSFMGLAGAACAALRWGGKWIYPAIFAVVPSLPYAITQPVPRYRYITFAVLVFLGCGLADRLLLKYRRERPTGRLAIPAARS